MPDFDIEGLTVRLPPRRKQDSKLGTLMPQTYHHLYDPAGNHARPPSVRRGVTTLWSPPYDAPAAAPEIRASDLAADAAGHLMKFMPNRAPAVRTVIHNQCCLDQQIVGSTCLRLEQTFFASCHESMTIGQLGTAGFPTAILLAEQYLSGRAPTDLVAITAADKWIAPYFRKFGDTIFADGGGCMLGGHALADPIARLQKTVVICTEPLPAFWSAKSDNIQVYLSRLATAAIAKLLAEHPAEDRVNVRVVGDGHGPEVATLVARDSGLSPLYEPEHPANMSHTSSASSLQAIIAGMNHSHARGEAVDLVVWTASVSGHAGAMRVVCYPRGKSIEGGWVSRSGAA